ncbi:MAG: AEC family transporter [Clostridia bacterium]|nr:AEC family transporter [Clostridia bacterium]
MLFLEYMGTAFMQVLILAVLVVTGFICDRTKLFTEKVARSCNDLLFYIVTPAVIINSFTKVEFNAQNALSFLKAIAIVVCFHLVGMVLVRFLFRSSGKDRPVFQYAAMYGNMGYMGLPLAEAVAGELGVFYCSAAVVVFNIFAFTHGISLMRKGEEQMKKRSLFLNPGTIGIVIGLPLCLLRFWLEVDLPAPIAEPIGYLGSLNTPLAMLMFGTYLANTDLPGMFKRAENYIVALVKLLLLPAIAFGTLYLLGVRDELLVTAAVFCGAPTANNTAMFAAKYGHDTGLASKVSGFTSMLSIVTLAMWIALAQYFG